MPGTPSGTQVVLAYGAESDRCLGVPGEEAPGVFAAREFVWWYNGHPDGAALPVDLSNVDSVAICGIGNVALDCARVLLRRVGDLASTDIAAHALAQLRERCCVREVHLFARRGPVQVGSEAGKPGRAASQVATAAQARLDHLCGCLHAHARGTDCSAACAGAVPYLSLSTPTLTAPPPMPHTRPHALPRS